MEYAGEGIEFKYEFLDRFFSEAKLPVVWWDLTASDGTAHIMSNQTVLEALSGAPAREKDAIRDMIVRISFQAGDVNRYLRHLAGALIE